MIRDKEQYFDEMLKMALFQKAGEETEALKKAVEIKGESLPPLQEERIKGMIGKEIRKRETKGFFKKAYHSSQYASTIILLFIVVSSGLILNVDAINKQFAKMILSFNDSYTEVELEQGEDTYSQKLDLGILETLAPTYIPEGFERREMEIRETSAMLYYDDDDKRFIEINILGSSASTNVDSEDAVFDEIRIKGQDGLLIEKNGRFHLIWEMEGNIFMMYANVSKEELIKVAESMGK